MCRYVGLGYAFAGATSPSIFTLGSQRSERGRYQLCSPSSFIDAGSSTARTLRVKWLIALEEIRLFRAPIIGARCATPKPEPESNLDER